MTLRTAAALALALLAWTPAAAAHQALPDPLTGTLVVRAGEGASVTVADLHPGDTLWVEVKVASGAAAVATRVRWTDGSGAAHAEAPAGPSAHEELKFVAPRDLASATIEITNDGAAEASVTYAYLSTVPFWRAYDLWLGTFAPFLLLGACVLLAIVLKPWIRARGTGPIRPPGWEEAQARKAEAKPAPGPARREPHADERRVTPDDQA